MRLQLAPRRPTRHAAPLLLADAATDALADALGFVVGAGSLLLYTPIALRLMRTSSADGLTLSTWWLKLASYSFSDLYCYTNGYPISQYAETLVITAEAACVLGLVAFYQRRLDASFTVLALVYLVVAAAALETAPPELLTLAQAGATLLNTVALLPQILLNARREDTGDYSPLTAGLACGGCTIRLFTTVRLASGDPLLLTGYATGLALNGAVLAQVFYYGAVMQQQSPVDLLSADFRSGGQRAGAAETASRRLRP